MRRSKQPGVVQAFALSLLTLSFFLLGPESARAQDAAPSALPTPTLRPDDERGVLSFSYENDIFSNTDRHYTNGVRASYLTSESAMPYWLRSAIASLPLFPENGKNRVGFALGQSMFTPENTKLSNPNPRDRPYAGWLYGSFGVVSEVKNRLDLFDIEIGVVGPSSLADTTQKFVHRSITGSQDPKGWDRQLHDEPGVIITYQRKWRGLYERTVNGLGVDVTPYVGGNLGNVLTQAVGGATLRIGYDLPADYGPPRIRPSLTGADYFLPQHDFGFYFFAGAEGRAVARNIFLDGNSFRDSRHVEKLPFVGDIQYGVAMTIGDWRVAYTQVAALREFKGQKAGDSFGSFSISTRF
ncbi:MAG: lipid A deacylase LpxR family protein [Elsteraceae bacterium]